MGRRHRLRALPGAGGGAARAHGGPPRGARHAHRLGQVAGRPRPPLPRPVRGAALLLYLPHQGAGEREVLRAVRRARRRPRGHAHRRRQHQPRRRRDLLHRRGARQPRPPRGRGPRRAVRGDGRVPLLRRPRPRLGVAGAAHHPAPGSVSPDVGHARRHVRHHGPHGGLQRPRIGVGAVLRPPGAARLQLPRDPAARDHRGPGGGRQGAHLPGQLHPARLRRDGAEADQHAAHHQGRKGRDPRRGRECALHDPLRQGVPAFPRLRHRRPPRRPASEVPAPGGAARAARVAQGDLRHRHPRRRHQHPAADGALHQARQVRRPQGVAAQGARVQADRRPRRAQGLRR